MARSRRGAAPARRPTRTTRRLAADIAPPQQSFTGGGFDSASSDGQYTGKYLVLLRDNGLQEGIKALKNATGVKSFCSAADYNAAAVDMADADSAEVLLLDKLKVAVVNADPTQLSGLQAEAAGDSAILAVEPEQIMYALGRPAMPALDRVTLEYLRGYKDAVTQLYETLTEASRSWTAMRNLRRSRISVSTPAGMARRKIGRVPAAWTMATAAGEAERSVINHELATSRMKLPVLPRTVAIQRTAKTGCASGAKVPPDAFAALICLLPR